MNEYAVLALAGIAVLSISAAMVMWFFAEREPFDVME